MEEELIVLVPMLIGMAFYWSGRRKAQEASKVLAKVEQPAQPHSGGTDAKIEAMEDRLRVLERIVTDRGYDVAAQIEALRDDRRLADDGSGVPLHITNKEKV